MATDLAEFVGAALGLHLVFGLSLWVSAILTGLARCSLILGLQVWGFRRLEAAITGFVAVIVLAFGLELLKSSPSAAGSRAACSCRSSPGRARPCSRSASSAPPLCRT